MKMLAVLAFAAVALHAQEDVKKNEIGGSFGWGNPFGTSVQYSRLVEESQTVGIAAGFSMSGGRLGLDYKYLLNQDSKFNPYLGVAGSYVTGLSGVKVNVNADTAKYDFKGGIQVTPRAGFRYQAGFANLYLNLGYGISATGGGVEYKSGSTRSAIKTVAKVFGMGGVEISGSMFWRI